MKLFNTLRDSIAHNNSEILVVENNKADNVGSLISCGIINEVGGCRPYVGCHGKRDKKMLQIWNITVYGSCTYDTIARHLELSKYH